MKLAIVMIMTLIFTTKVNAQHSDKIITLHYFAGGGNYNEIIVIGSDSNKIYQAAEDYGIHYWPDPFAQMFCFKPQMVEFLAEYISNRCIPANSRTVRTQSGYSIIITSDGKKKNCFIMGKGASKPYFIGLTKWLEESRYKNSFKDIIERIKPWTR